MSGFFGRIRRLPWAACCLFFILLGSCQNPSFLGKSIWTSLASNAAWAPVGYPSFTPTNVAYTSMAIAPDGTPYVAFEDGAVGAAASVMKFNGATWEYVGSPGFSGVTAQSTRLAIDSTGALYVAFINPQPLYYAVNVMSYTDATGWQKVGLPDFSGTTGFVYDVSLALDPGGVPCVAYVDPVTGMAIAMKFSAGAWAPMGGTFSSAGAGDVTIVFDKLGTAYAAFVDGSYGNQATAMRFTGSTWTQLGSRGFSGTSVAFVSLATDAGGVPYVAFAQGGSLRAGVMKFNPPTATWSYVGTRNLSVGQAWGVSLALSPTGVPMVAYQDGYGGPATVMTLFGIGWVPVGNTGFSGGPVDFTSLAIGTGGVPCVAYTESSGFATVMRYR